MCKQRAKVATQWNSGATRDSNRGPRVHLFTIQHYNDPRVVLTVVDLVDK